MLTPIGKISRTATPLAHVRLNRASCPRRRTPNMRRVLARAARLRALAVARLAQDARHVRQKRARPAAHGEHVGRGRRVEVLDEHVLVDHAQAQVVALRRRRVAHVEHLRAPAARISWQAPRAGACRAKRRRAWTRPRIKCWRGRSRCKFRRLRMSGADSATVWRPLCSNSGMLHTSGEHSKCARLELAVVAGRKRIQLLLHQQLLGAVAGVDEAQLRRGARPPAGVRHYQASASSGACCFWSELFATQARSYRLTRPARSSPRSCPSCRASILT